MRILRRPEVERITGRSCSQIYADMEQGRFPRQVPLSPQEGGAVGWVEDEILAWVAERVADRERHLAVLKERAAKREERQKRAALPPPKPSAMAPPKKLRTKGRTNKYSRAGA
jgi:prophage regulatory protein